MNFLFFILCKISLINILRKGNSYILNKIFDQIVEL